MLFELPTETATVTVPKEFVKTNSWTKGPYYTTIADWQKHFCNIDTEGNFTLGNKMK